MSQSIHSHVAIIGAGPYGLSAAAHLRAAGVETCVFGETMEFWAKQMPKGMMVRSTWNACHIADPHRRLTLDDFASQTPGHLREPLKLEEFIDYGRWFQQHAVPDLDSRRISQIEALRCGDFALHTANGDTLQVKRVVLATGIGQFAWKPEALCGLPKNLVSHSSDHANFACFKNQRVLVVGGGQSALESAALLFEAGADVEILVRAPAVHWLDQTLPWLKSESNPARWIFYPPSDVGPPGLNWIVATPGAFQKLPLETQKAVAKRSIRPAGSAWLIPRLKDVPMHFNCEVIEARPEGERVRLDLRDGSQQVADHVLVATGYRVNVAKHNLLAPDLLHRLDLAEGYPQLKSGLESNVSGLHFAGAAAAHSFGPVCRFVSGTTFCGAAVARGIAKADRTTMRASARPVIQGAMAPSVSLANRLFDLALVIPAILGLLPLLALIAGAVWMRFGRPILFRQTRPGLGGVPFEILKFRTMRDVRDEHGDLLDDEFRITPFGSWLRSTSLDELPELFNVLKGEMSLVGPRPLLMEYLGRYSPEQMRRHEVNPGLTGWAQINGRNCADWPTKFAHDVWYVNHRSLRLDMKILWLTLWKVLKREGINQPGRTTVDCFMPGTTPEQGQNSSVQSPT